MQKVSIFDIPLVIDGKPCTLLQANIFKQIAVVPDSMVPKSIGRQAPFLKITMGGIPNITMKVAYAHELMHALLESRPGCTSDLVYKETIPIFIERVISEKMGQETSTKLEKIRTTYEALLLIDSVPTKDVEEDGVLHAMGSLMGLKLYENYCNERKEKKKKEYFTDIQKIIDGESTVEDLLKKREVTINGSLDPLFIMRHL